MEACNDTPHGKLTEEVGELKEAIKHLEEKLVESNEALKDLQANKVKDAVYRNTPPLFPLLPKSLITWCGGRRSWRRTSR